MMLADHDNSNPVIPTGDGFGLIKSIGIIIAPRILICCTHAWILQFGYNNMAASKENSNKIGY